MVGKYILAAVSAASIFQSANADSRYNWLMTELQQYADYDQATAHKYANEIITHPNSDCAKLIEQLIRYNDDMINLVQKQNVSALTAEEQEQFNTDGAQFKNYGRLSEIACQ
jgi:hypothetical protein